MSSTVVIGPLPEYITIAKVRQVFLPFNTQKILLKGNKAYIKFVDPNDIESLDFKFSDLMIPQLGNAQIDLVPEDFNWGLIDAQESYKQATTDEFILSQKKQQPKPIKVMPRFIVITNCERKSLQSVSDEQLQKKLLRNYKLGRIIRYKTDIYIQFLDENQIERLDTQFPNLQVKELGPQASIAPTDENFNYAIVKEQVQKYEKELRIEKEREQMLRREKKKKQEQEIENRRREQQNLRKEEEKRMKSQEIRAEHYNSGWSVRPEGDRESYQVLQSKGNSQIFWLVAVAMWGLYVIFM